MADNILIAYYTWSDNAGAIAGAIAEKTGGTLFEIVPETPYPADYDAVVNQAKREIKSGYRPSLKADAADLAGYDTVFVGTPNWWSTLAPPAATFLAGHSFAGKTIVPFVTHGGGGLARCAADIAKLCPGAKVLDAFEIYGAGGMDKKLAAWLGGLGLAR